ncbi:TlpA family protein disulfide reductase [Shumkonia mesophila]|uniref:TlpA family protein disulfide reductase n=1 Tax=Shumkonia mesophila TaxID=2838854 RepID=UPI0029351BB7|nr:TlpA disulfide reductase family protein [Shumkonia mesophila]
MNAAKFVVAALVLLMLAACKDQGPSRTGAAAPELGVLDAQGREVRIDARRGQVVLINFWLAECGPCIAEMPALDAFYKENKARGFDLLAVNMGQDAATVEATRRRVEVSFPMLVDPLKIATQRYGAIGAPTSFIVDAEGIVRERIEGPLSARDLQRKIGGLL